MRKMMPIRMVGKYVECVETVAGSVELFHTPADSFYLGNLFT